VADQDSQERLRDSLTLRAFLEAQDLRLPGRSTVHENLNAVSQRTLSALCLWGDVGPRRGAG
jgi:hypothetical protein